MLDALRDRMLGGSDDAAGLARAVRHGSEALAVQALGARGDAARPPFRA